MIRPTVVKVIPGSDYTLLLTFDNGEEKRFDVKPYIRGAWYGALKDTAYFKSVSANGYNVEWADGQDLCPDELYELSTPVRGNAAG